MSDLTKTAAAIIWASFEVECPHCEHEFDLFSDDDDGVFRSAIFNNNWDSLVGCDVECPECREEFKLSEVIW